MNMKKLIPYIVALFPIGFIACQNTQKDQEQTQSTDNEAPDSTIKLQPATDSNQVDTSKTAFFENAALGGMVEVESSSKIERLTQNQQVKVFAAMMVKDHGLANQKLKVLADQKGYILPKTLPASKLELVNKINDFKDEGRNEYYVRLMINEHKNAINLFSMGERSKDADISKFSTETLPIIKQHYEHILKIDTLLQKPKANQGDDPLKISDRKKQ